MCSSDLIAVMSNTGTLLGSRTFNAFGNVVSSSGAAYFDRFSYTGLEVDSNTGYLYAQNRWYDPATQRWLTRDPIEIQSGQSNYYQYVANNAANLSDPRGLRAIDPSRKIASVPTELSQKRGDPTTV